MTAPVHPPSAPAMPATFDPMLVVKYAVLAAVAVGVLCLLVVGVFWLLSRRREKTEGVPVGVWAVVGRPGSGKTYFTTRAAVDALAAGRGVIANYEISGARRADSWDQLIARSEVGDLVIIDEAQQWWPSSAPFAPPIVREWLAMVRKRELSIVWTAQAWGRTSRGLRHLTRGVWDARQTAGVHKFVLYDGDEYGRRGAQPLRVQRIKRTRAVEGAYDTKELLVANCSWDV